MMKRLLPILLLGFYACQPSFEENPSDVMGYAPVYAPRQEVEDIKTMPVKATASAGKIYAYGNYLFQVDLYDGIHIIDNTNPSQAKKIAYLKVPLATEIAIRGGYLYTNNMDDLVVISLADITAPKLVYRLEGAFPEIGQTHPGFPGYFECVDPNKGVVVSWDRKMIQYPKCRR